MNTHNQDDRILFFSDPLSKMMFEEWLHIYFDSFIKKVDKGEHFKDELILLLQELESYGVNYEKS